MTRIVERINEILKMDIDENEVLDISRSEMIEKFIIGEYGWANVQKALFDILISGNKTIEEYDVIVCASIC